MAKDSRLYATFTVNFLEHPKIAPLSIEAKLGFIEMVLWCRDQLTDGRIPIGYAQHRWPETVLDELSTNHTERPTLVRYAEFYLVHDFAEHQTTSAEIRAKRAAAGRRGGVASGEARRAKAEARAKQNEANAKQNEANPVLLEAKRSNCFEDLPSVTCEDRSTNAKQTKQTKPETETETETSSGYLERASYVSDAHARDTELAMSERGLSPPVSVGASRLVAAIIGDKVDNAAKTMLRLQANKMLCEGRSDDDVTDCLRIWLTKPHLGAAGLSLCMTEVDKRKLTRTELSTSEKNFIKAQALKARMNGNTRKELHQ